MDRSSLCLHCCRNETQEELVVDGNQSKSSKVSKYSLLLNRFDCQIHIITLMKINEFNFKQVKIEVD